MVEAVEAVDDGGGGDGVSARSVSCGQGGRRTITLKSQRILHTQTLYLYLLLYLFLIFNTMSIYGNL